MSSLPSYEADSRKCWMGMGLVSAADISMKSESRKTYISFL